MMIYDFDDSLYECIVEILPKKWWIAISETALIVRKISIHMTNLKDVFSNSVL